MPTSTNVTNLKINVLTEAQYDTAVQGGDIGVNELSFLTDADVSELPDQTGQSGKFLTTDGTDASWSDKPLVNRATGANSIMIGSTSELSRVDSVVIGSGANNYAFATSTVIIGKSATANKSSVAVGDTASATAIYTIAIGCGATVGSRRAIQLGYNATNSDANTFKVANDNGNFEIMSADGKVPSDRISPVTTISTATVVQALSDQYIYNCGEMTSVEVTLPATIPVNFTAQLNFTSGATATTFISPNTIKWLGDNVSTTFTPTTNKRYTIMFYSDGVNVRGLVQAVAA